MAKPRLTSPIVRLLAVVAGLMLTAAPARADEPPAAAKLFTTSRVVVTDRFSVEVTGAGPDVIFIPGLASSKATWRETAERLRGRHRLHLVQVAGFSDEPARANAEGEVLVPTAEALDAYIVDQKLSPAVLVGHSLGGTIALYLAQKHPDHLAKVMIVDSVPFLPVVMGMGPGATVDVVRPTAEQMKGASIAAGDDAYAEMLKPQLERMTSRAEFRETLTQWSLDSHRETVAQAFYDDMMLDLRPGMAATKTPITVVVPDDVASGLAPGLMYAIYQDQYADAPAVVFEPVADAQHFVMWDQPQAFAEALDRFLAR